MTAKEIKKLVSIAQKYRIYPTQCIECGRSFYLTTADGFRNNVPVFESCMRHGTGDAILRTPIMEN